MEQQTFTIGHVLPWRGVGGSEIATLRLVESLAGYEFEHAALGLEGAASLPEFAALGCRTILYEPLALGFRHPAKFFFAARRAAQKLAAAKIDLLHCADILGAMYLAWAGKLAGIPVVCHVRRSHRQLERHERASLYAVTHFIFVSQAVRNDFAHPVKPERGEVIYDGLDLQDVTKSAPRAAQNLLRTKFGVPPDRRKLIGMIARVAPVKDFMTLIRAAAIVTQRRPDAHFVIIGDNANVPELREHYAAVQAELNAQGMSDRFTFTGFQTKVAELVAELDVVAHVTHREGFGLVLIEAMAERKPIVATAVGGIPEVVTDGVTGFLHAHENHQELAEKLLVLLNDEELAQRFGAAGRAQVETKFSRAECAAQTAQVYRAILARGYRVKSQ